MNNSVEKLWKGSEKTRKTLRTKWIAAVIFTQSFTVINIIINQLALSFTQNFQARY